MIFFDVINRKLIVLFDNFRHDDLPYFEPERLEQSVLYDVGTIQFKIEGQNLQDSTKNMIKNVTGDVSIRIPWNYTTSYCNE